MQDAETDKKKKPSYLWIMIRANFIVILTAVAAFLLAGRFDYWQGWLFFVTYYIFLVVVYFLFAKKQDLIQERTKPGPGVKWWDKGFFVLYIPLTLSVILAAALDAGRFHWSLPLPIAIYPFMFALMFFSYSLSLWAMWTNKFFSSHVRIQTDRGHYVITDGPYHFVRHPGYTSAIILIPAMAVLLGSLYALIPAAVTIVLIVIRTYLEDITLQKELPGYADYAQKTKFRLIPGIW